MIIWFLILVESLISINFTQRIVARAIQYVFGVTKLLNEIHILCKSHTFSGPIVIRVFQDRNLFRLLREIEVNEIKSPRDIGSSEKEKCLYISDRAEKCVWKSTRENANQHKIIKWLTTDYEPGTLSVSNDGQLLMVNYLVHSLMI